MNIEDLKELTEKKIEEVEKQMDFKYKDIIHMSPEKKEKANEKVRRRSELKAQMDLLESYNRAKYKFDEKRYSAYRHLNNEELLEETVHTEIEAKLRGGIEFSKLMDTYENMRKEFAWRIQNSTDVIENVRHYKNYNMDQIFAEDDDSYYDDILAICQETYQITDLQSFISHLSESNYHSSVVKFGNLVIGGIIYDNLYNIKALAVRENFRCCGIGTKLLYCVYEKAKKNKCPLSLDALPEKCSYFLLKNDFLIDTDEIKGEFVVYKTEVQEEVSQEEIEDVDENFFI